MSFDFSGKVALITGASSGIGESCAKRFAKYGAFIALTGRNEDNLKAVAEKCTSINKNLFKPLIIVADLTCAEDTLKVAEATIDHFKKLDILVNNAGVLLRGTTINLSLEEFDKQMNINVRSVFHLTKLLIPELVKTKGSIVNVSSLSGLRVVMGQTAYVMSKAAIDQFTRATALELAEHQVRVNAVNPGLIRTEIHKRNGMNEDDYEKILKNCEKNTPLGRHGDVEDVVSVIAFLASDSASYVTGATIPVDGGRHAMCPR